MASILYAWEMGSGLGHIEPLQAVGEALEAGGHKVTYAVRDPAKAGQRLAPDAPIAQAPYFRLDRIYDRPPLNYADVLARFGYARPEGLEMLVRGWLHLFEQTAAELVLANHAPSALLAAYIAQLPRAAQGTGFHLPPPSSPLPSLQPWHQVDPTALQRAEVQPLAAINAVVRRCGRPPLARLVDLLALDAAFLCTWPELDHYPQRSQTAYLGPLYSSGGTSHPDWADAPSPRVFAYLDADFRPLAPMLQQLAQNGVAVLLYSRDLPPPLAQQLTAAGVRLSESPVDLDWTGRHADLALTHGGHGTCAAMLQAGLPLLLVPRHTEQTVTAVRLQGQQLARFVFEANIRRDGIATALDAVFKDADLRRRVKDFAAACDRTPVAQRAAAIADRCQGLLKTRPNLQENNP